MSRAVALDLADPIRALMTTAGVGPTDLARALGIRAPSVHGYLEAEGQVKLATLAAAAEALGGRIEVRFHKSTEAE